MAVAAAVDDRDDIVLEMRGISKRFPGVQALDGVNLRVRRGEIPGTGGLERVVLNDKLQELRRETLLTELHQRIRDVRQGADGLLYVLTDENDGALLRLEPASR